MSFKKQTNRLRVEVNDNGLIQHEYGLGAAIHCPDGWNDSCPVRSLVVSVDEMRDLRYLLDRAIAAADDARAKFEKRQ